MLSAIKAPDAAYLQPVAPEKLAPHQPAPLQPASLQRRKAARRSIETLVASRPSSGLRILMALQRVSIPVTGGLMAAVLGIYGWSVYTQQSWSQAYGHLTQLQQTERELTAANEARKFEVTEQAEAAKTQYVPQGPTNTLFLKPAGASPQPAAPKPEVAPPQLASPIGY